MNSPPINARFRSQKPYLYPTTIPYSPPTVASPTHLAT